MDKKVKNFIRAEENLALCEAELLAAVAVKIKKDYHGYKLPKIVVIKIRNEKIYVFWRDESSRNYGFCPDENGYVELYLDTDL